MFGTPIVDLHGVPIVNVPSPLPSNTVPSKKSKSGLPSPFTSALSACPVPGKVGGVKKGFEPWPNAFEEIRNRKNMTTAQDCAADRRNACLMKSAPPTDTLRECLALFLRTQIINVRTSAIN